MAHTLEVLGAQIVAVGSFNPAIFTADWLDKNQLLRDSDAAFARKSESYVITREVAVIETEWFHLQVVGNRFQILSKDAPTPAVRDLAAGILSLVPHTPVSALGLNFTAHYRLDTTDDYHKVGDVLAPKGIWEDLFDGEHSLGMADLVIKAQPYKRGDKPKNGDEKKIQVQPSNRVPSGVFFAYNDHHTFSQDNLVENLTPAEMAVRVLIDCWDKDMAESKNVFDRVLARIFGA